MPSSRRLKITGFMVILTVLIIVYVGNGASNTHNSPFYTRTEAAIQHKQDTLARQEVLAGEKQRLERVGRIQKEHEKAVADAAQAESGSGPAAVKADPQKPVVADDSDALTGEKGAAEKVKPVAGRRKMKDDRMYPDTAADDHDGVAKVGNVEPKATITQNSGEDLSEKSDEEAKVEAELNNILKKGPIIIFSKSYCPHSMKAKHILLDLYTITPKPYVVELDQHELGPALQNSLQKSTGRRTVPNVLINGRSIGGGDDVQKMHVEGTLIETVQGMGGRRVMEIIKATGEDGSKKGLKFKA